MSKSVAIFAGSPDRFPEHERTLPISDFPVTSTESNTNDIPQTPVVVYRWEAPTGSTMLLNSGAQMAPRQYQSTISGVLDRSATGLHNRSCRLVNDQLPILVCSTSRRHKLPKL